ncbi:hypothetical protein E4T39_05180 [Aureobasidium subglaciale]|nr:hypothetical protein E4T39_05180 [Aureobasidium subglaciale]
MDVLIAKFDTDREILAECIPLVYSDTLSEAHLHTLVVDWRLYSGRYTGFLYYVPVANDLES